MSKKNIDIDRLIDLASFHVSGEEKKKFEKELTDFLDYADIIQSADCGSLEPASHAVEKEGDLRDDSSEPWDRLDALLLNAPLVEHTSYIVPPQEKKGGAEKETGSSGTKTRIDSYELEAVIGLEVHAQLKTRSKLFCKCSTEFGREPNENTCPVCSGQPGVLPVLNREAVNMAIMMGLATNCTINEKSIFARKNYFYPDLPKGYQISQFEEPICSSGYIEIELDDKIKRIRLNRIHMEEDAGKMVHIGAPGIWGSKASAVDFNRTSVPLIEIVSEPDISTPREAREYVVMLRSILLTLGICDGNMEEGSLRCDANISIRKKGDKQLGTKTEIKNMNSFKAIEKAIDFEIQRQIKAVKDGVPIEQSTRLWDESSQKTHLMRSKEESHDYRYFPDPDLMPLILKNGLIKELREKIPVLPLQRKKVLMNKYSFNEEEARLFITNPAYADFFEDVLVHYKNARNAANWFINEVLSYLTGSTRVVPIDPRDFAHFLMKIDSGEISGKIGKSVIKTSFEKKKGLVEVIEEKGLKQITDPGEIEKAVLKILEANSGQVEDYRSGKKNLFGFFVGQVMKETGGKASPELVNDILKKKLEG